MIGSLFLISYILNLLWRGKENFLINHCCSVFRYEEEKEALMRRLQGQDERFMSERQRQAELARLKREKLKAKQEDTFSTAALVLGLAEKQKAAVQERYVRRLINSIELELSPISRFISSSFF